MLGAETLSQKIEINDIIEATVVRIMQFGAIVRSESGLTGLVHISHVSHEFVQDINDHLCVGDTVSVKVLSVDSETGRLALSVKEATAAPPPNISKPAHYAQAKEPADAFEDKLKLWMKDSNERQAGINRRNNRR